MTIAIKKWLGLALFGFVACNGKEVNLGDGLGATSSAITYSGGCTPASCANQAAASADCPTSATLQCIPILPRGQAPIPQGAASWRLSARPLTPGPFRSRTRGVARRRVAQPRGPRASRTPLRVCSASPIPSPTRGKASAPWWLSARPLTQGPLRSRTRGIARPRVAQTREPRTWIAPPRRLCSASPIPPRGKPPIIRQGAATWRLSARLVTRGNARSGATA